MKHPLPNNNKFVSYMKRWCVGPYVCLETHLRKWQLKFNRGILEPGFDYIWIIFRDRQTDHSWRLHQMETFSVLLALCVGNSPVTGEFPAQRPVTRSFDVFFDLRLDKAWVNNRKAGDLRRNRGHYDVIVMCIHAAILIRVALIAH